MAYEIYESSPLAKSRIEGETDCFGLEEPSPNHRSKYPFGRLKIGQSFAVPISEGNENSLRGGASGYGKRVGGKKFTVIKHREHGVFEVARIY